ncbi:MAG: class I SAM-dependent methyltransferase [Pseudomonadota bacterium]
MSSYLDKAYDLQNAKATRDFYDDWAASYNAEIAENGYATPTRCAAALAAVVDLSAAVLDIGCGTGLSGLALRVAGFTTIDGTDLSPEMLARAAERDGVYRHLFLGDANTPLPVEPGAYAAATAVGVINPGHAPPETIDAVLAILPPGGCFAFSLNEHAFAEPPFPAKVEAVLAAGTANCLHRAHGPHLPGIGLEATVYVVQKS